MNKMIRKQSLNETLLPNAVIAWAQKHAGATRRVSPLQSNSSEGVWQNMVPYDFSFHKFLVDLVDEGDVPIAQTDDAVRRILRVKLKPGLWDTPFFPNRLTFFTKPYYCNSSLIYN